MDLLIPQTLKGHNDKVTFGPNLGQHCIPKNLKGKKQILSTELMGDGSERQKENLVYNQRHSVNFCTDSNAFLLWARRSPSLAPRFISRLSPHRGCLTGLR